MTTSGISQTGIESNFINQQMNEVKQQDPLKQDKRKELSLDNTDTVNLPAGIWEKELMEFDAIDEDGAMILVQLAANNLGKQPFSMSTEAGTEALRAFV